MSQSNSSSHHPNNIPTAMFADCLANSKEIFELIDSVFPADSCRHYQVLPLGLTGSDLSMGMLDPTNEESLKFINSIARVFKYNLQIKQMDDQTLQIILASYPQASNQSQKQDNSRDRNLTVIDSGFNSSQAPVAHDSISRRIVDSAPTIISQPDEPSVVNSNPVSKLDDLPPDLDFLRDLDLPVKSKSKSAKPAKPVVDSNATLYEIPPEFLNQQTGNNLDKNNLDDKATIIAEDPSQLLAQENEGNKVELALEEVQISDLLAEADLQNSQQKLESDNFLPTLNSQLSWQKLLEQAFKHQSEEVYLTRHRDFGNIVTNKNKLLQSSIEQVPLPIFCSVIDEIKRMARIPLDLSNHSKKVVLERFYQQERILLRLEFKLEGNQEIVIVQILRAKKLEKYEQQQMDKASEQALNLAKQLEKTLRRIQACFDSATFSNLRELQTVQSRINHQLRLLDKYK